MAMAMAMAMVTIPVSRVQHLRLPVEQRIPRRVLRLSLRDVPGGRVALSDADTAYASLLAGYVTANDPDNSMLMELLTSSDDDVRMPPGEPLSDAEVDAVRAWINNGAAQ